MAKTHLNTCTKECNIDTKETASLSLLYGNCKYYGVLHYVGMLVSIFCFQVGDPKISPITAAGNVLLYLQSIFVCSTRSFIMWNLNWVSRVLLKADLKCAMTCRYETGL